MIQNLEERKILRNAIDYYGCRNQMLKVVEELAELQCELVRFLMQDGRASWPSIAEELADVEIMLSQLRMMMPEGIVGEIRKKKLERLNERLNER